MSGVAETMIVEAAAKRFEESCQLPKPLKENLRACVQMALDQFKEALKECGQNVPEGSPEEIPSTDMQNGPELKMAIYADFSNDSVRIDFQHSIRWLALDEKSVRGFIKLLEEKLDDLETGTIGGVL